LDFVCRSLEANFSFNFTLALFEIFALFRAIDLGTRIQNNLSIFTRKMYSVDKQDEASTLIKTQLILILGSLLHLSRVVKTGVEIIYVYQDRPIKIDTKRNALCLITQPDLENSPSVSWKDRISSSCVTFRL